MIDWICKVSSDAVLFFALQVGIVVFAVVVAVGNWLQVRRARRGNVVQPGTMRGNVTLQVTRSEASMSRFYGTYAAISGILIAICLSVDIAKNHRVFWVILDVALVAYVCLFNAWFRNKLLDWSQRLTRIERR